MRFPLRVFVFLLIALTAVVGFTHYSKLSFLKDPLLKTLSNSLGRTVDASQLTVELGTEIGTEISTEIVVTITDLQIAPPAWQSSAQFVVVPRAQIKARIAELLESPPRLHSIEITSPTITLINDELNGGNWAFPSAALIDESQDDKATQSLPMTVANLSVTDALISYLDAELGPVKTARLSLRQTMNDASVSSRIEGNINQVPLTASITMSPTHKLVNLESAEFSIDADFGELTIDGEVTIKELLAPNRPEVLLSIKAPEISYLTDALELPSLGAGPLAMSLDIRPKKEQMALTLKGQFGDYLAVAIGEFDALTTLDVADLTVSLSGIDASRLGAYLPDMVMPAVPFSVAGNVSKRGQYLTIKDSRVMIGRLQATVRGVIPDITSPALADLNLAVDVPDINEFRDVLNLPSVISGPVSITMAIENGADAAKLSGSATTSIAQITLDGLVSKQADFTGTSATLELVGVELTDVTEALSLPMISDGPWRLSTNLDVREHTLALSNIALRTENAELFGESEVNRRFDEATVILNTDNPRPWLAQIELPANFNAARLEQSLNAKAKLLLLDEGITVEQMRVQLGASVAEGNLTLLGPESLAANISFNVDNLLSFAEKPPERAKFDRLSLSGTVHASLSPGQLSVEELSISMEDGTAVTARGDVQFSDSFDKTHFDVNAHIAHLASFSHLAGYALPSQPLTLRASLRASAGVLSAETFELKSGESDINGKLRIADPDHPKIQLTLRSKHVDLKPWIPERQNLKDAPKKAESAKPRVFDDAPIDIEFLTTFDAMLDIKIDKLSTRVPPFSNIVLKATNTNGRLIIEEARGEDNDGGKISIEGKVEQRQDDIAVNLALLGEGINVGVPAVSLEEAMALPRYDIDAFLYTQGNTARELAAGSNGYFEVQSGPGRVGKITAGLLTKDFFSELLALLNPFSKKQDHSDIECIALSGSIEQGKLTGDPALVVVTPALDIIAKGRVDLASEKLFGTFNTIPKKGVGLSATKALNPFVGVGGTLAKPALTLDPQGTIIQGGMAFFTGGLSILAKSFYDRLANSTDPCGDAMEQNAKGREQALKSYQLWSHQTAAE